MGGGWRREGCLKYRECVCVCVCVCVYERAANGEQQFVNVLTTGSGGGASATVGMSVTGGIEGKWLIFSLSGGFLPPGYYHFTTLAVEGLDTCDEGSFRLTKGVNSDPAVSEGETGGRKGPDTEEWTNGDVGIVQGTAVTFCGTQEEVSGERWGRVCEGGRMRSGEK